ncbi:phosphatidylinositol transfer protein beta [Cyclospora cayetanensis]|uniref:Phosphatidylinositol transfer protein beta n=1 Tax=Cyclospora cayetanensis TaxID=88456 RepID=A0A1D3D5M6_9EIME|nr:phosphatidylinositol transfer protein beta [Cyclospora cayetanensis]
MRLLPIVGWATDVTERPFAFYVEIPNKRRLVLSGRHEEISLAWLLEIQRAAAGTGAVSGRRSRSSSSTRNELYALSPRPFSRKNSLSPLPGAPLGPPGPAHHPPEMRMFRADGEDRSHDGSFREPESASQALQREIPSLPDSEASRTNAGAALEASHPHSSLSNRQCPDKEVRREETVLEDLRIWRFWSLTFTSRGHLGVRVACRLGGLLLTPSSGSQKEAELRLRLLLKVGVGCSWLLGLRDEIRLLSLVFLVAAGSLVPLRLVCSLSRFLAVLGGGEDLVESPREVSSWRPPWYSELLLALLEGVRGVAAAAATLLLLLASFWIIRRMVVRDRHASEKKSPEGPPALKAACLAKGSPGSLLLSAIPSDAVPSFSAEGGPPDPSLLAVGGPFLMECTTSKWGTLRRASEKALQLIKLIGSLSAAFLGGAFGILILAATRLLGVSPRLRRVSWCASVEGGGYLLLSQLSPLPAHPPETSQEGSEKGPLTAALGAQVWGWACTALQFVLEMFGEPSPWEASTDAVGGYEAFLFTPVPLSPGRAVPLELDRLQELQQQQRCSLASLRFVGAPDRVRKAGRCMDTPRPPRASSSFEGAPSSSDDLGPFAGGLDAGGLEELSADPPVWPTQVERGPCLVTWIGALRWGPPGTPVWLEALLTIRRAETILGTLLSQNDALRGLHAGVPSAAFST